MSPHLALISLCHFVFADSAAKMGVGCEQIPAEAPCELLPLKELSRLWCCCVGNISIKQEVIVLSVWMKTKTLLDDIGFQTCSYLWYRFGIHIDYLNHMIFACHSWFFRSSPVVVWTYYVHEGQEIFLNMLSAVEEMNRIVHSQQNLVEGMRG